MKWLHTHLKYILGCATGDSRDLKHFDWHRMRVCLNISIWLTKCLLLNNWNILGKALARYFLFTLLRNCLLSNRIRAHSYFLSTLLEELVARHSKRKWSWHWLYIIVLDNDVISELVIVWALCHPLWFRTPMTIRQLCSCQCVVFIRGVTDLICMTILPEIRWIHKLLLLNNILCNLLITGVRQQIILQRWAVLDLILFLVLELCGTAEALSVGYYTLADS